jgi:hypothetical protein
MTRIQPFSAKFLLLKLYFNETFLAHATGFLVGHNNSPLLVTNLHVLTGKDQITGECINKNLAIPNRIEIVFHAQNKLWKFVTVSVDLLNDESPRWWRHPSQPEVDLAVLPIPNVTGVDYYFYNISDEGPRIKLEPMTPVTVIGFPFGESTGGFPIWTTGFIASEPEVPIKGLEKIYIDSRTRQGQSGSPVITISKGTTILEGGDTQVGGTLWRFVGVYSGRLNKESDIGVVWKLSLLREIIHGRV